jgi:hypothetical protein
MHSKIIALKGNFMSLESDVSAQYAELISQLQYSNALSQQHLFEIRKIADLALHLHAKESQLRHKNPLNNFGKKCFSQTDEDGITLEILKRLNILENGVYAEYGVGNGVENNTLILAALGWSGFWVGGEELVFDASKNKNFVYCKEWITLENILPISLQALEKINKKSTDVISLDLDGNDIYFVEHLLKNGMKPKLFIVEYNARFPPPIKFQIDYDPTHQWKGDDYFGASLYSFFELFAKHGYKLVCCNSHTGANAFFVDASFSHLFTDVPKTIHDIYVEPNYYLYNRYLNFSKL